MNVFRILLVGLLLAYNVSFGQVNNYSVTIDGKYYNSEQLDSMLFAKEIDDIVRNLSTSRQAQSIEVNPYTQIEKEYDDAWQKKKDQIIREAERQSQNSLQAINADIVPDPRKLQGYGDPVLQRLIKENSSTNPNWTPSIQADVKPLVELSSPTYFGLHETDYYRFSESPCFEDLGFTPYKIGTPGYAEQLKNYQECEKEKTVEKIIIVALAVFLIIIIIPTYKTIKRYLFILEEKRQNKPLEIGEALNKLEQLQKALDSGLLNESTFQEMKAEIQARIKKNL
jgi:hypothetical protein